MKKQGRGGKERICEDVAESLCQYEVNKPVLYVKYSKGN